TLYSIPRVYINVLTEVLATSGCMQAHPAGALVALVGAQGAIQANLKCAQQKCGEGLSLSPHLATCALHAYGFLCFLFELLLLNYGCLSLQLYQLFAFSP